MAGLVSLWLLLGQEKAEVAKVEEKKEETEEFQEKLDKLREVEGAIAETQKDLEALSALSPEELEKREREREILSAQKATEDVFIEGVGVEVMDGKKLITNRKEGYRIEVPANLLVARSVVPNWLELHDKILMCQDPDCDPVMRIRAEEKNPNDLPIGEWLAREEKKAESPIYSPREKLIIQGETVYRVAEEIPARFEGYYYYWARGKKIYDIRISVFDDEAYRSSIETFSFLSAP